ncbi:MAG: hypothetical protein LBU85_08150 [Treponema sp.]|jgi:hypothetical protein|nr:hypothetical protein [Treponema sp.]
MKIYFNLIIISFLFFSCNNGDPKVDPEKIIGKEHDIYSLPYGKYGYYDYKNIEGKKYFVHVVYYKNKALVYIIGNHGHFQDYFFSNLIIYDEVKNIPLGTSYEEIIKKLGEPVGKYFWENNDKKKAHLSITYYQKNYYLFFKHHELNRGISDYIVNFDFDYYGKLINIFIAKPAP